MSAILSANDLNDFISPGVACIKPVETLPKQTPQTDNLYEVTTEDKLATQNAPPAEISLTDCLACSGCVTSAEAVLVSLQSHAEVLNALDTQGKVFVASVSPQVRASLAATYDVSESEAGSMLEELLGGAHGLRSGGKYGNGFDWIVDTNAMREASLVLGAEEVEKSLSITEPQVISNGAGTSRSFDSPKRPVLSSACPGWICYAEKTVPHVLPHLSRLKSPQALTGTLFKTVLSQRLNLRPDQIWHVAVMPCFDKKLEASREELTDIYWRSPTADSSQPPVRDVNCVITAREVLMLADSRGIDLPNLPCEPSFFCKPFPDPVLDRFIYPDRYQKLQRRRPHPRSLTQEAGTSGGYLYHILQRQLSLHPSSILNTTRGRNSDVIEYTITVPSSPVPVFKAARYYGFRNIQNLVRKLKPPKVSKLPGARGGARIPGGGSGLDYAYVEVMACPGGCTNGGGQIKVDGLPNKKDRMSQKEWLGKVDEAYFSMSDTSDGEDEAQARDQEDNVLDDSGEGSDSINDICPARIKSMLDHWASSTGIDLEKLVMTSYRKVESLVGKDGTAETERVVELAGKIGGGW